MKFCEVRTKFGWSLQGGIIKPLLCLGERMRKSARRPRLSETKESLEFGRSKINLILLQKNI